MLQEQRVLHVVPLGVVAIVPMLVVGLRQQSAINSLLGEP